ncbi:RNA-binding protein [Brevundimonas sp.]|uniref:RNA-binding protein n=1 Tax=Brevundimonas sp. TaxID=1871086 RepID=UPI003AF6A3CF
MTDLETFLDDGPGETWGVVCREGEPRQIFHAREGDAPANRLGAESVGRVTALLPGGGGAFVDLGAGEPFGFLARGAVSVGQTLRVTVSAEPRGGKGPALTLKGEGEGTPRLLKPGPTVAEWLDQAAPGVAPVQGAAAIEVVREARETALAPVVTAGGLNVAVERTRALIAVDLDFAGTPGRDGGKAREAANRLGLALAARRLALKRWGGLVVIDLIGTAQAPEPVLRAAREAFGTSGVTFGPLSRFGLLQLSMPWRHTPLEEALFGLKGEHARRTRQIEAVRDLRHGLESRRSAPWITLVVPDSEVDEMAGLVAGLGPRARLVGEASRRAETYGIQEG